VPEWDALWRKADLSVFQNFAWVRAFWRAYGPDLNVCSLVARRSDAVVAILPLALQRRTLRFLGSPESDYNDILCLRHDACWAVPALLSALMDLPLPWKSCVFENLPSDARLLQGMRNLPHALQRHLQIVFQCHCPTILLENHREETLRRLLQKKSLKRHENSLAKRGRVAFRHVQDRAEIKQHLESFFHQHITRHAAAGNVSRFLRPKSRDFYYAMVDELDPRSELRFSVLELNDRPVAYHFGFQTGEKYYWYKPAFDVEYKKESPGEVLLRNLFRHAQSNGIREFDFTIGDEFFKTRFANFYKKNLTVYFEGNPRSLASQAARLLRACKDRVKQNPQAAPLARSIYQSLTRIHSRFRHATP
jgi:CelD/BcsL family acetyltransferase involved in cellulose biosynthesis